MKRAAPRRTCLGCRQVRPQNELIRLARGADGRVRVDESGKGAGRGAYACPTVECLTGALRKGRLEHAFRHATLPPEHGVGEILARWIAGGGERGDWRAAAEGEASGNDNRGPR